MNKVIYHESGIYRVVWSAEELAAFKKLGWTEEKEDGKEYRVYHAEAPAEAPPDPPLAPSEPVAESAPEPEPVVDAPKRRGRPPKAESEAPEEQ